MLAAALVATVSISVLAVPASAADDIEVADSRYQALLLLRTGGPSVARAAEQALVGSDEDVATFLVDDYFAARQQDDLTRVEEYAGLGGTTMKNAAESALLGSVEARRTFLNGGWEPLSPSTSGSALRRSSMPAVMRSNAPVRSR